jgi:hypothetical protein
MIGVQMIGVQMSDQPQAPQGHADTVREALSRNVGVDVAARIGYLMSRFFIPPFVVAHIGLQAYGLWATVFILVSYVGMSTLGVSNAYVKYIAQYMARGQADKANALLSTGVSADPDNRRHALWSDYFVPAPGDRSAPGAARAASRRPHGGAERGRNFFAGPGAVLFR